MSKDKPEVVVTQIPGGVLFKQEGSPSVMLVAAGQAGINISGGLYTISLNNRVAPPLHSDWDEVKNDGQENKARKDAHAKHVAAVDKGLAAEANALLTEVNGPSYKIKAEHVALLR